MSARAVRGAIAVAILFVLRPAPAPARPVAPVMTAFASRLRASGRAETRLEREGTDPMSGAARVVPGRLALEWPDRARLEFTQTGERLTLRADGGEWLEPNLKQMIRFSAGDASGAYRWWRFLLGADPAAFSAVKAGPRRWTVTAAARDGLPEDHATITLGPNGLPLVLEVEDTPGAAARYRFRGWTFAKPKGPAAFVLEAPPGFAVVPLH